MQQAMTIETLLLYDSELSSLPEIFIRVSELLDDENSSSIQIGQAVETDPSLTSRILKMVNSAYYGFQNNVASISPAISILGRDRIRQILLGAVLGGVFGNMKNKVFFMEDYWHHSVKTAILSRLLCKQSNKCDEAESLFTAGLLHEIGRLIMVQKMPELSMEVQQAVETGSEDIYQAEQRIFGYTHCEVGAAFITHWGLPDMLAEISRYHHTPDKAEQFVEEVKIVNLAKGISFLISPIQQIEVEYALEDIADWEDIGLSEQQITEICIEADEQVYQVMESLGMVQMKIDLDDD
ncbi:MAG: HDOD domain-containing protein [Gammaproteobacteria bacterium]|nr:HDOD domain-containing protein [Gammaproteobacteria bacterium]